MFLLYSITGMSLYCVYILISYAHTHSTSVGHAGTFCVLSSVLEQLKVEGIVDLFFTIHSLRQQQPGLIQTFVSLTIKATCYYVYTQPCINNGSFVSQELYKFCYDTTESLEDQ